MSWLDDLPASERDALRDAGRIGASRYEDTILVPVPEAARLMGVSEDTIRALEASGTLPSIRIGRRVLFARAGLEDWALANQRRDWALANQRRELAP